MLELTFTKEEASTAWSKGTSKRCDALQKTEEAGEIYGCCEYFFFSPPLLVLKYLLFVLQVWSGVSPFRSFRYPLMIIPMHSLTQNRRKGKWLAQSSSTRAAYTKVKILIQLLLQKFTEFHQIQRTSWWSCRYESWFRLNSSLTSL